MGVADIGVHGEESALCRKYVGYAISQNCHQKPQP